MMVSCGGSQEGAFVDHGLRLLLGQSLMSSRVPTVVVAILDLLDTRAG